MYEYRLAEKWLKRLQGKVFDSIVIKRGYPKRSDESKIIVRPWRGFKLQIIVHPHFGDQPVHVCAIPVN